MGFTPTTPPTTGCYVTGLQVHNALWDTSKCTIKTFDVNDLSSTNELPLLHIIPQMRNSAEETTPVFSCALIRCEDSVDCGSSCSILDVTVPVETERVARDLTERKVFISSSLK